MPPNPPHHALRMTPNVRLQKRAFCEHGFRRAGVKVYVYGREGGNFEMV